MTLTIKFSKSKLRKRKKPNIETRRTIPSQRIALKAYSTSMLLVWGITATGMNRHKLKIFWRNSNKVPQDWSLTLLSEANPQDSQISIAGGK